MPVACIYTRRLKEREKKNRGKKSERKKGELDVKLKRVSGDDAVYNIIIK